MDMEEDSAKALIFTYGTLKKGFSNHYLIESMSRAGDADFLGTYRTTLSYPLVCGPFHVPFLLNMPGSGSPVAGELYSVSAQGIARIDDLEGTSRGHYERLPIEVVGDGGEEGERTAYAYYAHSDYAAELWRRSGEKGLSEYSLKEAQEYVKRQDRPTDVTFLDHIRLFISSSD